MNKDAVQHERGPRKPKNKPMELSNGASPGSSGSLRSLTPSSSASNSPPPPHHHTAHHPILALSVPHPEKSGLTAGVAPTASAGLISASVYYGTFYHSLLTAEHYNINPLVLDFARSGEGGRSVGLELGGTSPDNMPEVAARLLFTSVKWAKNITCFRLLPYRDQLILLEETWRDLFLMGMSQWAVPLKTDILVDALVQGTEERKMSADTVAELRAQVHRMEDVVERLRALKVDFTEFACLKAVALFKAETPGLSDPARVESLQDQAQVMLGDYVRYAHLSRPTRFGRLLLALPAIRAISSKFVERLFFQQTIGDIPIERLLSDMFQNS
ncbi:photoreceptor-specific nuclear receptor-like [Diadema setosum]|uniref:photoreceptor-specific nuclear receptor-like n=1 Tax=Diadema setosum TaxID=31175 RepID=UPI003B3A02AE